MEPHITKIQNYSVTYFNKEELKILKQEIFQNEIYSVDLNVKNPIIYDIGAHIGLATLYFKSKYPKSIITCFEPNPNVIPLLQENIQGNNLNNMKVHYTAIAGKEGYKDLYIDNSGLGAFSTSSFRKNAWNHKQKSLPIKVKAEVLSKYVDSYIDLMKIDVEGTEREVIKELHLKNKLKYIKNLLIEYHPIKNHKIYEITSILEKNGFVIEYKEEGKDIDKPKEELILIIAKKSI